MASCCSPSCSAVSTSSVVIEFTPDFLCALRGATGAPSDESLIIEVKGLEREQDRSRDIGARRWQDAVNHWGKLGRWRYAKIHTPYQLSQVLGVADGSEGHA